VCRTLETPLTQESLTLALRPTLAAKQYGSEDLLSRLVSEAVMAVMPKDPRAVRRTCSPSLLVEAACEACEDTPADAAAPARSPARSSTSTTCASSRSWAAG